MSDTYYKSSAYTRSIERAIIDSQCGSFGERDKRFVAALLECGLTVRPGAAGGGRCPPTMAPRPVSGGYPYPSYIVRTNTFGTKRK
jgi:hypothetical protein